MKRAEQRFQRGKRYYQANEPEQARTDFDAAIDLMLQASEQDISDRQAFDQRLDAMVESIHRYDLSGLGAAVNLEEARFEKAPLEDILEMTFPVDPKLKDRVGEQVKATVSQLPLAVNDTVLGYIHYFSGRGYKALVAGLQRAGRYRPMIQRILDEEGVPPELIHLAQAESGFLPRAVSRARATGMWQFMNWRGNQYGLMQTRYTDDRLDPEKATRAAARHLRDLYHTFGDWYLAIAAYNCGPGVIERAVERTGYADFWELRARRVIPAETTNYVPIILAMTIMAKNSVEYGLQDVAPDAPLEYDTVAITSPTSLSLVADMIDVPVSELLAMNPALLKSTAPEGYSLHVPRGTGSEVMAGLRLVPSERRASWRLHRVESGETLAAIGKRYGTAPGTIAAANNLASESPEVGQRLLIPAAFHETDHAVKRVPATRSTKRTASRKACPRTTPVVRRASTAPSSAARTSPSKTGAKTSPAVKRSGPRVLSRTASARNPGAQGN